MARQKLRTVETRQLGNPYDEATPLEIAGADITSTNLEQYIQFIISQMRQILGTAHWNSPVPIQLQSLVGVGLTIPVAFSGAEAIGDLVYSSGPLVDGHYYDVRKVDPTQVNKLPAIGIITGVESWTRGTMRMLSGVLSGMYSDLIPGKVYWVGTDARLVASLAELPLACYIQRVGVAIDTHSILLNLDLHLMKRSA